MRKIHIDDNNASNVETFSVKNSIRMGFTVPTIVGVLVRHNFLSLSCCALVVSGTGIHGQSRCSHHRAAFPLFYCSQSETLMEGMGGILNSSAPCKHRPLTLDRLKSFNNDLLPQSLHIPRSSETQIPTTIFLTLNTQPPSREAEMTFPPRTRR